MKLENKLIWPFVIFFISLVIIELVFFNFFSITKKNYENIVNYDTRFADQGTIMVYYNIVREASFQNYLKSGQEEFLNRYNEYLKKSEDLYALLGNEIPNKDLQENYQKEIIFFNKIVRVEKGIIDKSIPETYLSSEEYLSLKDEFYESKDLPKEFYQIYVKKDMKENIKKAEIYLVIMIIVVALTFTMIISEFLIVKKDVINPMKKISKGLSDIRKKKFDAEISVEGTPVMANVMKDLNETSLELKKFSSNLKNMVKLGIVQLENRDMKGGKGLYEKVKYLQNEISNLKNMVKLATISLKEKKK